MDYLRYSEVWFSPLDVALPQSHWTEATPSRSTPPTEKKYTVDSITLRFLSTDATDFESFGHL